MSFIEFYEILNTDITFFNYFILLIISFIMATIVLITLFLEGRQTKEDSKLLSFATAIVVFFCGLILIPEFKYEDRYHKLDVMLYDKVLDKEQLRILDEAVLNHRKRFIDYSVYQNKFDLIKNGEYKSYESVFKVREIMNFISDKNKEDFAKLDRVYIQEKMKK